MANPVSTFGPSQPSVCAENKVQKPTDPRIEEIFFRKSNQEQVDLITRPDFIRSFTVADNKIYLLTHALPVNIIGTNENTDSKVVVLDFTTHAWIEDINVLLGRLPYHLAIFDRWIVCAAQERGVLAFFDRENKLIPPVQLNLDAFFDNREGGIQGIAVTHEAIYVTMWTYCNLSDRQGHIIKIHRNSSLEQVFFPQKIEVLFTEKENDVACLKVVSDKLYFSNGTKVFRFDETSKTAELIFDGELELWSFDILPNDQVVIKKNNEHQSKACIKACDGYLFYESFNGLNMCRVDDKTIKTTKKHAQAYDLKMIEVYNGTLLALHRNYQYRSSALIIWSGN